jgi:hypothetical protein
VTPIIDLLGATAAVVLERIAKGGGATKWYYCPGKAHLEAIEAQVSPRSVVSFYFDDRIRGDNCSPEVMSAVERIIARTGEAVVGALGEDGLHIDVEILTGPNELAAFASKISPASRVFYGVFPARDNDGVQAVTVVLLDADGIVRPNPH